MPAPPRHPRRPATAGGLAGLLPVVGSLGTLLVLGAGRGGLAVGALVASGLMVSASVAFAVLQLGRARTEQRAEDDERRDDHLDALDACRAQVVAAARAQRRTAEATHPHPGALPVLLAGAWRPSPGGEIRWACGTVDAERAPALPEGYDHRSADPLAVEAVRRFAAVHARVDDVPLTVAPHAEPPGGTSPAQVVVVAHTPADAAATVRAVACSAAARGWSVTVSGPGDEPGWLARLPATDEGAPRLHLTSAPSHAARRTTDRATAPVLDATAPDLHPDRLTATEAEAVARALHDAAAGSDPRSPHDLGGLLGLHRPGWRRGGTPWGRLRVPIGHDEDGRPLVLDLREAALGGSGPHGLVVGATGSGKSELLRSLVVGLALTHSPEDVTVALVDFKGGATFRGLEALPHVAGVVTNLESGTGLVERWEAALSGELVRRQATLHEAGCPDRDTFVAGGGRLPSLLVVVDEFSELLLARPEAAELFATVGRLGRSLGVHLLLATQRLEVGRLRGLEAHLSYRIALRTFSAEESRAALGSADAAHLPRRPGLGYLRTAAEAPVRFQAVPCRASTPHAEDPWVVLLDPPGAPDPAARPAVEPAGASEDSLLAAWHGVPATEPVWLPALERSPRLLDLAPAPPEPAAPGAPSELLHVAVGLVDDPHGRRQPPWTLCLDAAHAAVVGGPRSGVSHTLRSVVLGLATRHGPDDLRVYVLSPDGALEDLATLPQVACVAGRRDPALVRRCLDHVAGLIAARELGQPGGPGRVLVVVDDWAGLREEVPDAEAWAGDLARRGLGVGVHLLLGAGRWADVRPGLRDLLGTRVELRLGDPTESELDRVRARAVPSGRPGHGLALHEGVVRHLLVAGPPDADDRAALTTLARRHPGEPARLPVLPGRVLLADLPAEGAALLGVRERDLAAVAEPTSPGMLVVGDPGSGRTATLRLLGHQAAEGTRVLVVDPRGTLRDAVEESRLLEHVGADAAPDAVRAVAAQLGRRIAAGERGPAVLVLADDVDLLPPGTLDPLVALLPRASDAGLRVALARRVAGAGRWLHEPCPRALRECGAGTLLLSGDPEEGPLAGRLRPEPQPPGRGRWVAGGAGAAARPETVQVAWVPPASSASPAR